MTMLLWALLAFVGSHFILSHPLRQPLVSKIGEQGFLGFYSVVALATFAWVILAYRDAPAQQWWSPPAFLYPLTHGVMLFALVLFIGSLSTPNPALPGAGKKILDSSTQHSGIFAITRHPMMWGFGLWGIMHALVNGDGPMVLLGSGMAILAFVGAALQDHKKRHQLGELWIKYEKSTSYMPFGAQLRGRLSWGNAWPGWIPVMGGIAAYALLVYFHVMLFGVSTRMP